MTHFYLNLMRLEYRNWLRINYQLVKCPLSLDAISSILPKLIMIGILIVSTKFDWILVHTFKLNLNVTSCVLQSFPSLSLIFCSSNK